MLGEFILSCEGEVPLLFTENETNHERLFPGQKNESRYVKDGINDCVVQGNQGAVNPEQAGHQGRGPLQVNVGAGQTQVIRLRLSKNSPDQKGKPFGEQFDEVFADISNLVLVGIAFTALAIICVAVPGGRSLVHDNLSGALAFGSGLQPLVLLALFAIEVNLSLFFFNLLPIPPLDGSRVVRNMLPYNLVQQYDRIGGWISWILMIVVGSFILRLLIGPSIGLIFSLLMGI